MSADERLSRDRRIRKRKVFLRVQGSGRKYRSDHFLLAVSARLPLKSQSQLAVRDSRLGITVTTKVHKRAVVRNKLKRRVREYIRRVRPGFTSAVDLVVIARDGATGLSFEQLTQELQLLLRKARLLEATTS